MTSKKGCVVLVAVAANVLFLSWSAIAANVVQVAHSNLMPSVPRDTANLIAALHGNVVETSNSEVLISLPAVRDIESVLHNLGRVERLSCLRWSDSTMDQEDLRLLAQTCRGLKELVLEGPQCGDEGVAHISSLPHLQSLSLVNDSRITDAGVRALQPLRRTLVNLDLRGTSATGAGLNNYSALQILRIGVISDEGLAAIKQLKNLRQLNVAGLQGSENENIEWLWDVYPELNLESIELGVTAGYDLPIHKPVRHASNATFARGTPTLRDLYLSVGLNNDVAKKLIMAAPNLERLRSDAAPIADEGMAALSQLKNLQVLQMGWGVAFGPSVRRNVTTQGFRHLQASLR